jgi:hypothetical protein
LNDPYIIANTHQWQDLGPAFDTDSSWQLMSITVYLTTLDQKILGDGVLAYPHVFAKRHRK